MSIDTNNYNINLRDGNPEQVLEVISSLDGLQRHALCLMEQAQSAEVRAVLLPIEQAISDRLEQALSGVSGVTFRVTCGPGAKRRVSVQRVAKQDQE